MSTELKDRGKALEDQFFKKEDDAKLAAIREKKDKQDAKEELREVSGMDDDEVLDKLVELGISAETIAAVSLVPLVEVAWADGEIQDSERKAILHGAKGKGIKKTSHAFKLLSGWLEHKPSSDLFDAWAGYIGALNEQLTDDQLQVLKRQVVDRARHVAEVAGGFLGFKTISKPEEQVLQRLADVFDQRGERTSK